MQLSHDREALGYRTVTSIDALPASAYLLHDQPTSAQQLMPFRRGRGAKADIKQEATAAPLACLQAVSAKLV